MFLDEKIDGGLEFDGPRTLNVLRRMIFAEIVWARFFVLLWGQVEAITRQKNVDSGLIHL